MQLNAVVKQSHLNQNPQNDGAFCAGDAGAFFPLAVLNPINKHQLGKTIRLGSEDTINPLMDRSVSYIPTSVKAGLNPRPNPRRTTNPNALSHVNFELADLMEPTKVLCKVDGVLNAYKGQVDVTEGDADVGSDNEMNISMALCSIHVHSPF